MFRFCKSNMRLVFGVLAILSIAAAYFLTHSCRRDTLFEKNIRNEEFFLHAVRSEYKNYDVNLLYEINFLVCTLLYKDEATEHTLHNIESTINDIEKSDTFTHAVNSIGLWNLRLYESQLYHTCIVMQFNDDEVRAMGNRQSAVRDTILNMGNQPSATIGNFLDDIYRRIQEKLIIRESLNIDEIDSLLIQHCKTDVIESQIIKNENYGFSPETAIDLSCFDSPVASLLKFTHKHFNSSGIGIVSEMRIDNDTALYTAEFYHRPTRKKYTIYFLANPHKLESH